MSLCFIDSNVILYLLSSDHAKADRAEMILSARGVISVQVLNEIVSVCLRKLKMSWDEIEQLLAAVRAATEVVSITVEMHDKARDIAKRYQYSFYDALICAAALLTGASTLLTEDMHAGMNIEGLTITNPFR